MEAEFARERLSRVPLAEAVRSLWRWVADPLFLLSVFTRQRGLGYEKEISFGVLVQLIAGALLEHQGSGRKSFARGREQGVLTASVQAARVRDRMIKRPTRDTVAAGQEGHDAA